MKELLDCLLIGDKNTLHCKVYGTVVWEMQNPLAEPDSNFPVPYFVNKTIVNKVLDDGTDYPKEEQMETFGCMWSGSKLNAADFASMIFERLVVMSPEVILYKAEETIAKAVAYYHSKVMVMHQKGRQSLVTKYIVHDYNVYILDMITKDCLYYSNESAICYSKDKILLSDNNFGDDAFVGDLEDSSVEKIYLSKNAKMYIEEYIGEKEKKLRKIIFCDGTGMRADTMLVATNAPEERLKALQKESDQVFLNGKDYDDVPIWADVLESEGYIFNILESSEIISVSEKTKETGVKEVYIIDDHPNL